MTAVRTLWAAVGMVAVLGGLAPVLAHHSFGLYDMTKTAEVDGSVDKMEWSNPHCWLFIWAAGTDDAKVSYGFEMTSVGEMTRRGWKKSAVKPGDSSSSTSSMIPSPVMRTSSSMTVSSPFPSQAAAGLLAVSRAPAVPISAARWVISSH